MKLTGITNEMIDEAKSRRINDQISSTEQKSRQDSCHLLDVNRRLVVGKSGL